MQNGPCETSVNSDNNMPEVEVLLATYNGEKYLVEQLDSLLAQTYQNWRITAADDGSTDSTRRILEEYAAKDGRITLLPPATPHGSACANFMSLLRQSTADYIMFCDQDDVWRPEKIQYEMRAMRATENRAPNIPILVATDLTVVTSDLKVLSESFWSYQNLDPSFTGFKSLVAQSLVTGCTVLVNRALVNHVRYQMADDMIMHDWWLSLIAAAFGKICMLEEKTVLYRQHGSNSVGAEAFSVLKKLRNISAIRLSVMSTINQADAFLRCYGESLSPDLSEALELYARIKGERSRVRRMALLLRSGIAKSGCLRRMGQMYAIATL